MTNRLLLGLFPACLPKFNASRIAAISISSDNLVGLSKGTNRLAMFYTGKANSLYWLEGFDSMDLPFKLQMSHGKPLTCVLFHSLHIRTKKSRVKTFAYIFKTMISNYVKCLRTAVFLTSAIINYYINPIETLGLELQLSEWPENLESNTVISTWLKIQYTGFLRSMSVLYKHMGSEC